MKKLLTLYFSFGSLFLFAQNNTIDSLQQALKRFNAQRLELNKNIRPDEGDTTKIKILTTLSFQYIRNSDYSAAKTYADDALTISQQINYKPGIAESYNCLGVISYNQGNYPDALKNHLSALKIHQEIGDKIGIGSSYGNIGNILESQGNYPKALENYFACLKLLEEGGNIQGVAHSYNNIGVIYRKQGNYPEALKNYTASLKISKDIKDKTGIANAYGNIGNIQLYQSNYPEALKNISAALKIYEEIGDKLGTAISYNNLGLIYCKQGNDIEGLKNYYLSLKISEEINDKEGIIESYINIGKAKVKSQPGESKDWLMKGFQLAKEVGSLPYIKDSYEGLSQADSSLNNFKGAFENHKLFVLYRDSLNNEEASKKLMQATMQNEYDKKEAETKLAARAELNKQKLIRNGLMAGFAIVLLFAGVFFRQRNSTHKEKIRAEEEKKRSDNLLLNILPAEVAEEIKSHGTAKAKAFTMVTVMFTDFKDFTSHSEKVSAELLVEEIHTCFSAFDNILNKYRIEKIKTVGDAYLCASGLPVTNYTHAVDMVNAALEIRNFMKARKIEKESNGEIPFEIRIGIHTGPVVAGVVGTKKYAYDIWGDTVNIAARMEQNSEAGKINISGSAYELVKSKFNCIHRGKISAKNKGEIDMFFVEPMEEPYITTV